eukprot:TRINITY_DN2545_c0_g6_i1.p2 TRINITY_DN2545_c0_g6~~TRINITY_DN2545_c0_g6_i1.p2  ORF type:complete len:122 (-),score=47.19 TRINITY_DN2545_c0_g6_i1:49-372(-)
MKNVAAYLLLSLAGKEPSKEAIEEVLKAGGVEVEEDKIDALLTAVGSQDIAEIIEKGRKKIGSVAVAAGGAAAPAAAAPAAGAAPAKKEEKKVEEEEDEEMGFGLFD